MPRGDGTGPAGAGPTTGRAAGYCAGYGVPGFMNPAFGMGRRAFGGRFGGRGGGFGWRHWFHATGLPFWLRPGAAVTTADEAAALKQQADALEQSLAEIRQRLAQLEQETNKT